MAKLVVVDDEPNVRYSLEKGLQSPELIVLSAGTARDGIECVRAESPDVVILDVRLPDLPGLAAYEQIRDIDPRLPVIIITAHGTTETAIEAMKLGAFEYLLKPVDLHQLRDTVAKAIEVSQLSRTPALFADERSDEAADRIVGSSAPMQEIYKSIGRVAAQDVPVLITGESGTGKELVARAIYQHSRRSRAPFLAINCAAIPEALLESELFGHERGAFTGADRRRIGKFEQAHGGTILMDEIGDMSLSTQAKILRLLQDQQFERLGGNNAIATDVRVIAATNQDLEELVAAQRFRQDLLFRLNVFRLRLPPLRERIEDLSELVAYFLNKVNRELGKTVHAASPDALRLMQQHRWPGNVRELHSAIKFALVHATANVLLPEWLPENIRSGVGTPVVQPSGGLEMTQFIKELLSRGQPGVYDRVHTAVDQILLDEVLRFVRGNQVEAAELLGVSRNTLRARLRTLGISIEKQITSETDRRAQ